MKRCSRQKWLVESQQHKADAVVTSPAALSANVRKGSDVLSEVLAEDSRATRIGLSAAARKAAETLAKMPGSKVIKHGTALRHRPARVVGLKFVSSDKDPLSRRFSRAYVGLRESLVAEASQSRLKSVD
jgi:hypothetical protein